MRTDYGMQRLAGRRVTRRAMLRGAGTTLGAVVIGGGLLGCGRSSSTQEKSAANPVSTPAGPKRGGALNIVLPAQLDNLNPQTNGATSSRFIYDTLFYYDYENGKYELGLAESLEIPDSTTFVFKMRPNATFQNIAPVNGRPVTSGDVVASFQEYVTNPRTVNKTLFEEFIDRYETPDQSTLRIKMKKPNAWAIGPHGLGSSTSGVIVPKELTEGRKLETVAIGPGPYVLDQFDPRVISFKRRPDGWRGLDRPYIDQVTMRLLSDAAVSDAAFKSKQIDTLAARDKLHADQLKSIAPDVQIDKELDYPAMLFMKADPQGLFADARVREAVYNALDVKDLIDRVELGEAVLSGPVPAQLAAWSLPDDELKKVFPHNVQKAKDLLAAAGWDGNREVELKYPTDDKSGMVSEIIQKHLAAVGIKTKLVPQERRTVFSAKTMADASYELAAALLWKGNDPDMWLRLWTTPGASGRNYARWSDAEVDSIVGRQQAESSAEKQKAIILDAQRLILKKFAPIVNLYSPYAYTARWSYYHPALHTGYIGVRGHYSWLDDK